MVIDFHTHTINYDFFQPWFLDRIKETAGNFDNLRAEFSQANDFSRFLSECGIDFAVVMADHSEEVTGLCSNETVHSFCQDTDKLIPFCNINPLKEKDPVWKLRECVEKGFKGLKLYPTYQFFNMNDPVLYPLYELAQEIGMPVSYHTGISVFKGSRVKYGEPIHIDDVAVDFPDLKIIMAHSGRGTWYEQAALMAKLHKNVYMEISGLPARKLLTYFPDLERLQDKVVYGSDWPEITNIKKSIDTIKGLPISEEAKEKILGGNAKRLLGID